MELACLGLGKDQEKWAGPSCHLLQVGGAHLLLECPLDLSMLHLFLPAGSITMKNKQDVHLHDATTDSKRADGTMVQHSSAKRQHLAFYDDDEDNDQTSWFHIEDMHHQCTQHVSGGYYREEKESRSLLSPPENTSTSVFMRAIDGKMLLEVEPWYKSAEFSLLDVSSLNAVLISNPEGMLGLPFLTRMENFSGKVYATSVTAKLGQLMMEELVSMHAEYVQNFGRSELSKKKPVWLNLTALNGYPASLKKALVDDDGVGRANWQCLYRKKDIEICMKQVHCLHYDEEISIYDCLCIKPCSSGSELGASNWIISGARRLSYFSAADFTSGHSMALNVASHVHSEIFLFSDLKSNRISEVDEDYSVAAAGQDKQGRPCKGAVPSRQGANLVNELAQVCNAMLQAIVSGGSVLALISGIGAFLEALEVISQTFDSSGLSDVPLFFISPVADELLVYSNTIPEWLCAARQEKLYAGEALFHHVELLQQKRLHQLPTIHSAKAVKLWREPCVVFALNWGLRMGPAVPLLYRWKQDPRCLLVLSQTGTDAKLALAPFQPLLMKVLQYNRGGKLGEAEVTAIIEKLKPELSLVPETMRDALQPFLEGDSSGSTAFYNMWDVLTIPGPHRIQADMAAEVACSIRPKQLESGTAISQVTMSVCQKAGKWLLEAPKLAEGEAASLTGREDVCWGSVKVTELVNILQERGLCCELSSRDHGHPANASGENVLDCCIDISFPSPAKIELRPNCTLIETDDTNIRKLITDAVNSFLTSV